MDKNALMNYALSARKELESQIALSLNRLGFFKNSIKKANIVGDFTIIEGSAENFPKSIYELRQELEKDVRADGFQEVVEEAAYTWFNRIVALRFMEVYDYFSHGFCVLTSRDGSFEPEILKNVMYVIDDLKLDFRYVQSLYEAGKQEELYRHLLFKQCNCLSKILPMLFGEQAAYMELLLPNNLLSQGSVIRQITTIPEEDFKNDVEVIGWLYQFYNSVKKDAVFASKEKITKETLPAVTQLFTPDWIVRYMAQNSVGRIWIESYPDSPLQGEMKYYVEDAKQEIDAQKKLDEIRYRNVDPKNIRVIEPCCGSGHILVYVFDLLFEMYKEFGYSPKDIPGYILRDNLYGLDVDKRAAQLSQFALMMKARSIDPRFFDDSRIVIPHVHEIQDSQLLTSLEYKKRMYEFGFASKSIETAEYLAKTFENGKIIGSLLIVQPRDYASFIEEIKRKEREYTPNLFQQDFAEFGLRRLIELAEDAEILSGKYDVMITNPPYCGSSALEEPCKRYAIKHYPDSKSDMFAMFMQTNFVKKNGYLAMINMHSWMFLSSYEKLRKDIIAHKMIVNMVHLGAHAFESIGGEVVQTTSFVIRNTQLATNGVYFRLVDEKDKESTFLSEIAGGGNNEH